MNDLLRRALADAELSETRLAERLGVDPKTVRRWIGGRDPYPRHRRSLATLLGVDEVQLWPNSVPRRSVQPPPTVGILTTYPHRWAVPRTVWQALFGGARREIGVLAYAGLFLAEDAGILRTFAQRAHDGVLVRILVGDPDGGRVPERGKDEGVGDAMAAKVRNALVHLRALRDVPRVEIRLHDTVLYNSIYRADDDVLINSHAYGMAAAQAPVLHLRRAEDGDMASTYLESFERVWANASPLA